MSRLLISRTSEEFCDDDSISRERKTREFWRHTHTKKSRIKKEMREEEEGEEEEE